MSDSAPAYFLTFDRGNSTAKAAVWAAGAPEPVALLRTRSAEPATTLDCLGLIREALDVIAPLERFDAAAISSTVRDEESARALDDALSLYAKARYTLNAGTAMPLKVAYTTPGTLGSDRLAAALGAREIIGPGRDMLVVDLGTAITYDHVSADATFRGGNIAPGVSTRLHALHAAAPVLPVVDPDGPAPLFGDSTDTAIRSGVLRGVAAELDYYRRHIGADTALVLTGGDAALLADAALIEPPFIINPLLNHLGLKSLILHNENLQALLRRR